MIYVTHLSRSHNFLYLSWRPTIGAPHLWFDVSSTLFFRKHSGPAVCHSCHRAIFPCLPSNSLPFFRDGLIFPLKPFSFDWVMSTEIFRASLPRIFPRLILWPSGSSNANLSFFCIFFSKHYSSLDDRSGKVETQFADTFHNLFQVLLRRFLPQIMALPLLVPYLPTSDIIRRYARICFIFPPPIRLADFASTPPVVVVALTSYM